MLTLVTEFQVYIANDMHPIPKWDEAQLSSPHPHHLFKEEG